MHVFCVDCVHLVHFCLPILVKNIMFYISELCRVSMALGGETRVYFCLLLKLLRFDCRSCVGIRLRDSR